MFWLSRCLFCVGLTIKDYTYLGVKYLIHLQFSQLQKLNGLNLNIRSLPKPVIKFNLFSHKLDYSPDFKHDSVHCLVTLHNRLAKTF